MPAYCAPKLQSKVVLAFCLNEMAPTGVMPDCKTTFTSDLYKSRDTYGNFLRLVRPTGPC